MSAATYKNTYKTPPAPAFPEGIHLETPVEDYDLNFCLTVPGVLKGENRLVELEPLVPSQHAQAIFDMLLPSPGHFRYCPGTPWQSMQECLEWIETFHRSQPSALFYVIRDLKGGKREVAGMMNYIRTSEENLLSELGWIFIASKFQRTHVQTHAASLMLEHAFKLPSEGGWGLRRMQWQANDLNKPSVNAALRLGFVFEGTIRADRSLAAGQEGAYVGRDGDPLGLVGRKIGRSTAMLSITAQDWEDKTRAHVFGLVTKYQ